MTSRSDPEGADRAQQEADAYDIRFEIARPLAKSAEPSDYVVEVRGTVRVIGEQGTTEIIGWVFARVVQAARAYDDGVALFEVCDSVDQSLHDHASAVYDWDNEGLKTSLSDGCMGAGILVVESVQIVPARRGQRIGLLAMQRTIDTFGSGCALVVIKPFPLQFGTGHDLSSTELPGWEERMAMKSYSANKKEALAKLRAYWARLGFERIGKSAYFALDLQLVQADDKELMQ